MIEEYCKKFNVKSPNNTIKIGKKYYMCNENVQEFLKTVDEDNVLGAGVMLGEEKRNKFKPTSALIEHIGKETKRKLIVNEKSAWLFICGRDVFSEGIEHKEISKLSGEYIVTNKNNETLGVGKLVRKGKTIILNNVIDIGIRLRQEMD